MRRLLIVLSLIALLLLTIQVVHAATSSGYDLSCLHCAAGTRGGLWMAGAELQPVPAATASPAVSASRMQEE